MHPSSLSPPIQNHILPPHLVSIALKPSISSPSYLNNSSSSSSSSTTHHSSSSSSPLTIPMSISLPTCANCATQTTPLWRRDEAGNTLCNACALFLKMKGRPRPISLKTDFIKQRNRSKASDKHPPTQPTPPAPTAPSDPDLSPRPKRRKSSPLASLLRPAPLPATRTVSADRCRLAPSLDSAPAHHHLVPPQPPPSALRACLDDRPNLPAGPSQPPEATNEQQSRGRARARHPLISLPPLAQLVGALGVSEHPPSVSRGPPTSFEASAREARYHSPPITQQHGHLFPRARSSWLDPGGRAGSVISSVSDTDSVISGAPSPASTTQRDAPLTPPVGGRLPPIGAQQGPLGPHEEVRRLRERVAELELINGIMQSRIGELGGGAKGWKRLRGARDKGGENDGCGEVCRGKVDDEEEWEDGSGAQHLVEHQVTDHDEEDSYEQQEQQR